MGKPRSPAPLDGRGRTALLRTGKQRAAARGVPRRSVRTPARRRTDSSATGRKDPGRLAGRFCSSRGTPVKGKTTTNTYSQNPLPSGSSTSTRSKAASTSRRTLGSSLREVHRGSGAHDGRGPSPSPSKTRSQTASPSWRINAETQAVTASQIRGDAPCGASAKAKPLIVEATGPIRSSKSRRCASLDGRRLAPHATSSPHSKHSFNVDGKVLQR